MDLTLYQFSAAGQRQAQSVDQETNAVQITGEPLDVSEEPLVMDTFHLGFGYSWRLLQGTYAYAENADCRFPRLVLPGPLMTEVTLPAGAGQAVPRCGQDYNGHFYVGAGRYVYRIPNGTGTPVQDFDLGAANIAWAMDTFLGNLYVGTSTGQTSTSAPGPLVRNAAGTWTGGGPNRKSIAHAWYQATATGTTGAWQLIGQDSLSSVTNVAADPMIAGNWGASISVGDTTYGINSLVSDQGHVYVAKTNGLHDVDGATGFTPNLMPFYEAAVDDDNGVSAICANGSVYVNDLAGLFRLDVSGGSTTGRITTVTPGHGLPNETPIRGKILAQTSYGPWIIAAVYNGADSYIMWGRDIRQGDAGSSPLGYGAGYGPSPQAIGPSPMLWHGGLIVLPGERVRMLAVSGLTSPPRLWVGSLKTSDNSVHLRWGIIPRTENPMQDSEMTFATDWEVHIPGQDWQHPVTTKDLLQIDVQADGLLAPQATLDFTVGADGGSLVDFGTATESPQSTIVGADDFFGRRIALCMDGTNPSYAPIAVRALMLRAQLRPALRRVRTYNVLLGEGNVDRFGGRDITRTQNDYWKLEPLQWGGRVHLRDEFGEGYDVLVLPPIQRRVIYLRGESGKGTAEPVIVATLTLKILAADPAVPVTWPPVRWDDGVSKYDTDVHWGSP
ncbi:MAG TPA: hypothetical protein VFB50_00335 [Chloroflexota bacterium]|nr:hypothetical protein [Chloroflexota bacterium]